MNEQSKKAFGLCLYKIKKNSIHILLCKAVKSREAWGLLKGVLLKNETFKTCAQREVEEESSILVKKQYFEEYFEQKNKDKDIGIWLVNANNIKNLDDKFLDNKLLDNYLSWENQKVKFFNLNDLPMIKDKQKYLLQDLKDFLQNKN